MGLRVSGAPPRALTVLHLRNSDRLGGPERLLLDQAARTPPDVRQVLASFARPGAPHPFLDEAERRGLATLRIAQRGAYDLGVLGRTRAWVQAHAPDVLVGHDYKANLVLWRVGRRTRRPWMAVVHGYTAEDAKVRLFEALDRRGLRHAAAVVAVSEEGRAQALAAGVLAARVHVVPNAIDVEGVARTAAAAREARRAAWGLPADALAVLCLGRLSPEKGQALLLDAWARLPEHGLPADLAARAVLLLVGDGADRAALEARARPDPRVRLLGWRDDPHACLGAADLLVLPSSREGLPLAVLEAMAAGVPVLATAVGGVPEALEQGACGRLVPPGDARALAAALTELLAAPAERARLGAAARDRVARLHDAPAQAERLAALYRAVAAG